MGHQLKSIVSSKWLANTLHLEHVGEDAEIKEICALNDLQANSLVFSKTQETVASIDKPVTVICSEKANNSRVTQLLSKNPRLGFIKAVNAIAEQGGIEESFNEPDIHPTVKLGQNVVIEPGVTIGKNCEIQHNVVIKSGTVIGKNCIVQPCAVLGEEGFGFEPDENGNQIKMHHLGRLIIGDNVQIGVCTAICKGTLGDTVIGNCVKIDNLVHIAHNCQIGENTMIIACAELSGGVKVGKNAWIAPNSSSRQKLSIGDNAVVGLGAVVVKSIDAHSVVAGNPAKKLK